MNEQDVQAHARRSAQRDETIAQYVNIGPLAGSPEDEDVADEHFRQVSNWGLARHHALADAGAQRAAYVAVKSIAVRKPR